MLMKTSSLVRCDFPVINPCRLLMITLSFTCLEIVFQGYLLHHLPRDQGESYHPVVPQILLLALEDD